MRLPTTQTSFQRARRTAQRAPGRPPQRSQLLDRPEIWEGLERAVRPHAALLDDRQRADVDETLRADLVSEYDARFLVAHLQRLPIDFSAPFQAALASWNTDEELHCRGFAHVVAAVHERRSCDVLDELQAREQAVDFEPLAELFEDEFSIACLFAYDEIATVRAYRANAPHYELLGGELVRFTRQVTADEGAHCGNFLDVVRREHGHRRHDVERVVERIRGTEGLEYRNTFVLDHDDNVWSEAIFDDAARLVLRHAAR